jgi:serine/threonine-protein kinase
MNAVALPPVRPVSLHAPGAPREFAGHALEAPIARGRFATVYRARDLRTGRRIALKLASVEALLAAGQPGDFAHEAHAMACVGTGAAPAVLGAGRTEDDAWLAMELLEADWRALPWPATVAQALRHLGAAARALAAVHDAGWVHRDVKPANLLLRADGRVALTDYATACRLGAPGTRTCIGTPRYTAPEQSQGAPADPAADVYSLGVLAHEWLAAAAPFPGATPTELVAQHLMAAVPVLPGNFAALQPLVTDLLAKDAAARPARGGDVALRLARITDTHTRQSS